MFLEQDLELLEINPLAKTEDDYVCLDALAETDDDASYGQEWDFPPRRGFAREKTDREKRAEKVDEDDQLGIAGKYTELDGYIGMMHPGGVASLTNMDALIQAGSKPPDYTE